jgi:hypothetical protein
MAGDFSALKVAQQRSDVVRAFNNQQMQSNYSFEVTSKILDFLVSDNGRFLRDPLVEEIVETIDALGLTSLSLLSLGSRGILPLPSIAPDRERVEQFFRLVRLFVSKEEENGETRPAVTSSTAASVLGSLVDRLGDIIRSSQQPTQMQLYSQLNVLISQVASRVSEKNVRRLVRRIFNPDRIEETLPILGRALDAVTVPLISASARGNRRKE